MSSRAALDKDLIVKCVAEHHPDHKSDRTTLSTSLTKGSDAIPYFPHERFGNMSHGNPV